MGKASSAKKVARAARTGGGRTRRGTTSWVWPGVMAAVVILGTAGIVYSRDQRQPDNTRPFAAAAGRPADHWHSAIGYYICGTFVPNLPEGDDPLGIHGHGDNVIHIHPFGNSSAGKRATLEIYFDTVGADISDDKIELPGQDTKRNGDRCEDGPGQIRTKVWDKRNADDPGRVIEGDPSAIRPQDNQLITIAFVPEGVDIPKPPSTPTLDNLSDVAPPPTAGTSTTTAPTTTAPDPTVSTTSSVPDPNTSPQASTSSTTRVP
ncbi:MAG: hypothetical protein M3450_00510 [Actinomycetota bacterium]|nr:hypothetical protein [Actinomycetota bacterium]